MTPSRGNDHTPRLEAQDLTYRVEAARLLDSVGLTAGAGEFIGLVGPNGAGKTTLLKALAGLLYPQEGEVLLDGQPLGRMSAREVARRQGVVHQSAPVTFGFTALELVLMGRYPHLGRFQVEGEEDRCIALEAMAATETAAFADRAVVTLSGGERQRVFIARALAQQPQVLLLDEPTSNLDIQHQLKALDLVRTLVGQGVTAVAAIHDLGLAARYCGRLLLMAGGRIVAQGTPQEVLTPANLEAAFGVRAVVFGNPFTGAPVVSLVDYAPPPKAASLSRRVHVICGGGSGARLLYEMHRRGYALSAGVLGAGDADRLAADVLGIPYVSVPAFSPIDDEAHRRHLALAAEADVTVVCDMPIGANNLRNLEAAAAAQRLVLWESTPITERDFTQGTAAALYKALLPLARCATMEEILAAIEAVGTQGSDSSRVSDLASLHRGGNHDHTGP
ncbi:MAG: heme ABC transporter ATP-binding protein [Chloroflexi bacterium]|nr:heme ABC transporter ATP-binding protein [Chloroflexota bacterium]